MSKQRFKSLWWRRRLESWAPDQTGFWNGSTLKVANRNLIISIINLVTAFMVWMVWSGLVVYLSHTRPDLTTSQLYWLTGIPMLSAGTLRIFYSFMVPSVFGGRTWTILSTAAFLPALSWMALRIDAPDVGFVELGMIAGLTGLAGANFASSCANVSLFYPKKYKGLALGVNAAVGNLGVGLVQLVVPLLVVTNFGLVLSGRQAVLPDGALVWLRTVPVALMVPTVVGIILAYAWMDDIVFHEGSLRGQLSVLKNKHTWIMSFLYTATFGSFIGFASVFPILLETHFPGTRAASLAFIGATLSSLMRPIGHVICLKADSVRLTVWSFGVMIVALGVATTALPGPTGDGSFWMFLCAYFGVFVATGLGKGSTTHMIPEIFHSVNRDRGIAARDTASVIGFSSAIATIGAFFVPSIFTVGMDAFGDVKISLYAFMASYVGCIVVAWYFYQRAHPSNPLLDHVGHGAAANERPRAHTDKAA